MRTDLEALMKASEDSVMVIDLGQAGDSSRFLFFGHHQKTSLHEYCDRVSASAEVVSPTPASARTQLSGCFRTLTSPSDVPQPARFQAPLASPPVYAVQTTPKPRAVLPPLNGGLHCGTRSPASRAGERCQRAPASQRRAPLRRDPACRHMSAPRTGAPASQRRAPLRRCPLTASWHPPPLGAPASQRRAPLRPADADDEVPADRRGAPASQRRAPLRRHPRRTSPAASTGAPASQRRAPLRPGAAGACAAGIGAVLPPLNGGLHCGARRRQLARYCDRPVLPPLNGGLHCGVPLGDGHAAGVSRCSRLSTAGSIAARRSIVQGIEAAWRAPASQRRAPLRPGDGADRSRGRARCSRLSTAGSIAASLRSAPSAAEWQVLPPLNGGLHCGEYLGRHVMLDGAGAPASQRRAPLRLRARAPARRSEVAVLPPLNGGLHCGLVAGESPDDQLGSAPASQRRAPLRPDPRRSPPCGRPAGAPASQRRAPLRLCRPY